MPDARLLTVAALVRENAVLADIGTDHAYLPLYLLAENKITRAVATDIGEGPLARANAHIAESGEGARIKTRRCDGLDGVEEESPTDIAICGMGGEMIARIIDRAPFVKNPEIRLILQPMTRAAYLRRYLAANGFCVTEERLTKAAGRIYACMAVSYDGVSRSLSAKEAELGTPRKESEEEASLWRAYLLSHIRTVQKKRKGLASAGRPTGEEDALLAALTALQEKGEER